MSEKSQKEELYVNDRLRCTCVTKNKAHARTRHDDTRVRVDLPVWRIIGTVHSPRLSAPLLDLLTAGRMDDSLVSGLCTLASLCCVLGSRFARSSVVPLGTFYLSESSLRRKTLRVTIAVAAPGSLRFARDSKCVSSSTRSSLPSSLTWNQFNVT